jgi:uncharacterized protein YbaR (Trm112 family)
MLFPPDAAAFVQALDLLACPACLQPLRATPDALTCTACGRVYPVLDGIPILLADRASLPSS